MSTPRVLQHLYLLDTSSPDLSRYLYYLIQSDDEEQYLSSLQGLEMTRLVDFLDKVLDVTPITDDVSRRCLHKLQAICGHHNTLPSSYNVSGNLIKVDTDPVASGGFSDVWEGIHNGKEVCIKRLRITQQTREAIEKAFCKEAVIWKRLRHPNIVAFIGVTQNPLQFVSEWMPNGTLTEYLTENPGANRIGLLLDVAEGLAFLHAIHTTHGDLKGPNVLIDLSGHARLTDFGFTSVVRGVESILVTGVQGYSARWAAPEVLGNGDKNTREADVFSFGMIVIEAFTGRHPFSEFSALATISKIIAGERPDRPQEPGLTDLMWDTTLRCWDGDPARRPAMANVVGILRECSRLYDANLSLFPLAPLPPEVLASLPESEVKRQTVIRKVIEKEQQYIKGLNFIEEVFICPLRNADPPVIRGGLNRFINEVFGNILDLRECNRHLLGTMYVRQREQGGIVSRIGDIFLNAATELRLAYLTYIGQLATAERKLEEEMERNREFRVFLEQRLYHQDNVNKMGLGHWLSRPLEHLLTYPVLFEALLEETAVEDPEVYFLKGVVEAMRNIQGTAQLKIFQMAMGKGPTGKFQWHNLVPEDVRNGIPEQVAKRQATIFELIQEEMAYVKDLGNIEYMFIQPLRSIIPRERLETFIRDVFYNFNELHVHHRQLLNKLFEIQMKEHPIISSIAPPMGDAFLNSRDAYLKYIPNFPIAEYRIDDEMANNPRFKAFVDKCVRHPDAHRLGMKDFIHRPTSRLVYYDLLLASILKNTPTGDLDLEKIPVLLDGIKDIKEETEPLVALAKRRVEMWEYIAKLVFATEERVVMDLFHENRSLIHTGRFWQGPETVFGSNEWVELFVFLFDNYLVMTIPNEENGVTKYHVYQRPIPLDLLTLRSFDGDPLQRADGGRAYPCKFHCEGRSDGLCTLFTETSRARLKWEAKLEEAIGLRKAVQESNKTFEVKTLGVGTLYTTFRDPLNSGFGGDFTGKATCSFPFTAPDGHPLVVIGSTEGVWIGSRHDSQSMRRVLDLQFVRQCAILEEFGVFLVLADKSLFACRVEGLMHLSPDAADPSQAPQKLSRSNEVQFFTVGNLDGRTVVIYMKKKNRGSTFRVLEPVLEKISGRKTVQHSIGSRFGLWSQASDWFRVRYDFTLPCDSYDLFFLEAQVVVLCGEGFEIMDLSDFKSSTTPGMDGPWLGLGKRAELCRHLGLFTSGDGEFLLCFDEFGQYIDRHGDPFPAGTVEWEGKADRVAWHSPYILLFNPQFIEIRHAGTGRLVQIIFGNDMWCTWDGRGANQSQPIYEGSSNDAVSQQSRVHGVSTKAPQPDGRRVTTQHVFELVPAGLLPLPRSFVSLPPAPPLYPSNSSAHLAS